ncbi:MAG TPA: S8 family serine peptidase, partial [Pyrinomonadaceae bacterium]|nr:S8 family serine peptidase [Pyrinomonadaceae bacterium]
MSVEDSGRSISISTEAVAPGGEIVEGLRVAHVAPEETKPALRALRSRSDVIYAEPNFIRHKSLVPNDPNYAAQWALHNTGQNGGTAGVDIKAEPAWDKTTGSRNIVVGIVDEGIDIDHPDLKDNIWKNPAEIPGNGIDDDGDGLIDDVNGWDFVHNDNTVFDYALSTYPPPDDYQLDVDDHGTHIAGIIGATGNNATGVVGVNWQVSLLPLKFIGPSG